MTPAPQVLISWWIDHVGVPVLFTFFGASLGFGFGRLKDWLDDRKAREAFLRAIRVEMQTIRVHLQGTLKDALEYKESLERGERKVLYLVTMFQTTVYHPSLCEDVNRATQSP
jgi:hypothetical protein